MIRLVVIGVSGTPEEQVSMDNPTVSRLCAHYKGYYEQRGFQMPWVGFLAVRDHTPVGLCGFRSAPDQDENVEVICRVLDGHERQGLGASMMDALVGIARDHNPQMKIWTVTQPRDRVSAHLLERTGFTYEGMLEDGCLGQAWQWRLAPEASLADC